MASRYTVFGTDKIDQRIDGDMKIICQSVLNCIPEKDLLAIILGGGYGRGEGGVFFNDNEENLFNDYDFYIVVRPMSSSLKKQYQVSLREAGEKLGHRIGIEVDFGPLLTPEDIRKTPYLLRWYELKAGHIVIWGDTHILDAMPDFNPQTLPLLEAMALMLNRGAGLLLAQHKLESDPFSPEDEEFITRNIQKAIMAAGDAILILNHQYHYSYQERVRRLTNVMKETSSNEIDLVRWYDAAMTYKLKPWHESPDPVVLKDFWETGRQIHEWVYYQIPAMVAGQAFMFESDYYKWVLSSVSKPENGYLLLKHLYQNFRDMGVKGLTSPWNIRYPRWRLYYALPGLLYVHNAEYPEGKNAAWSLGLGIHSSQNEMYQRFIQLWNRYN